MVIVSVRSAVSIVPKILIELTGYLQSSVALTYTPSDVVKDANYYHMQGSDERIYDGMLGGTGSAIAPPIELFCRTFAYFKGLYANKALPIPSEKLPWVAQLITFSSLIFVHEANRRAHIQQIFRKILGRGFSCIHNVDNTKLDYCIIGDSMLLSVFEDAQRWGPDPGVLAGASYRRYYLQLDVSLFLTVLLSLRPIVCYRT